MGKAWLGRKQAANKLHKISGCGFNGVCAESMSLVEKGLLCACCGESCTGVTGIKCSQAETLCRLGQISGCFQKQIVIVKETVAPGRPVSLEAH